VGLDPGIDHMLIMRAVDSIHDRGGVVTNLVSASQHKEQYLHIHIHPSILNIIPASKLQFIHVR